MKRLRVLVEAHPPRVRKLKIGPGTRPGDLRAHLKLDTGYLLHLAFDPADPFLETDDVFLMVRNGERLVFRYAPEEAERLLRQRVAEADAFMEHLAFGEGDI